MREMNIFSNDFQLDPCNTILEKCNPFFSGFTLSIGSSTQTALQDSFASLSSHKGVDQKELLNVVGKENPFNASAMCLQEPYLSLEAD